MVFNENPEQEIWPKTKKDKENWATQYRFNISFRIIF